MRRLVFAMLLAVVVYGGVAIANGLGALGEALGLFRAWTFFAACALAFGNYALRYVKWEFYLARLGIRGVSKSDSFLTFLSGFVLTVTPGKVGEVFKSVLLFETHGVAVAATAPIVVAERATDVLGIAILIALASVGFAGGLVWAGVGISLVLLLLALVANRALSRRIIAWTSTLPGRLGQLRPRLETAYESLVTLLQPKNLIVPTLLSIAAWLMECLALWVILLGFGEKTSIPLAAFFYATSTLIGAIIPVPGGLGVTEGALMGQMIEIGHVARPHATAAMILVRFATLWFAVFVGFVALSLLRRRYPALLHAKQAARPNALPTSEPPSATESPAAR